LNDEHENSPDAIRVHRETDSNGIDESASQDDKRNDQRIPTFRTISIDSSDEYQNADDSIRVNRKYDSYEIDDSGLPSEEQNRPRISISAKMSTFENHEKSRINRFSIQS
jgi:hypothetical protein